MTQRKSIGKKTRFDVFKRDGFACQYCGSTPPAVVLEVDHVIPVSSGGENDKDNLVTACSDCNRGKGAESLEQAPESLAEKTAIAAEKEDQFKEYKKLLSRKRRRQKAELRAIEEIFEEVGSLTNKDKNLIRAQFLAYLMPDEVEEAMQIAVSKHGYDPDRAWRYFCGICWRKIKEPRNA